MHSQCTNALDACLRPAPILAIASTPPHSHGLVSAVPLLRLQRYPGAPRPRNSCARSLHVPCNQSPNHQPCRPQSPRAGRDTPPKRPRTKLTNPHRQSPPRQHTASPVGTRVSPVLDRTRTGTETLTTNAGWNPSDCTIRPGDSCAKWGRPS